MSETDYFVAASECHLMGGFDEVGYYPDVRRWFRSAMQGVAKVWGAPNPPAPPRASELIKQMDEAGVDVAFGLRESMMDVTGFAAPMSTNGFIIKEIEPYPERMYLECNVGPILHRGVKHAIWELEYLVKEKDAKLCKVYACEDGPLNDPAMWPFYAKASELNIPLTIHMLGQALEWAGEDKIVFGLDWPGVTMQACVDYIRTLEIPVELQEQWGYPAVTDETRAKILGLNLARLTGIEPTKRVPASSGS